MKPRRLSSEKWKSSHVRSSQYLLQIVKCDDIVCCIRSSYRKIVKDRFPPPPFSICQSPDDGLTWTRSHTGHYISLHQTIVMSGMIPASAHRKYPLGIPYDAFNPAVKDDLKNECAPNVGCISVRSKPCRCTVGLAVMTMMLKVGVSCVF